MNPQDWTTVRLSDVATFSGGTTPSRSRQADYFDLGTHLWVKTMDLNNWRIWSTSESVTDKAMAETSLKIHPSGTVLVAMYGGFQQIGRTGILSRPAAVNQAITAIYPNRQKLVPDYLLHTLNFHVDYWKTVASSSRKDPNITSGDVKDFPLLLPPTREEQAAISQALNNIEFLIASLNRLLAKKRSIQQGMAFELLTGRTRLPGFDSPWREVCVGNHVTYVKTVALSRAQLDTTSPLRYLHYGDIHTSADVRLAAAEAPMPRAASSLASSAGRLQIGDLVFADASEDPDGVGKSVEIVSVPTEGLVPGLHTIAARFDKAVLADGFKAYLQFIPAFRHALLRLAAGTKVLATTRSYISSITLALPAVDEQQAIAKVLIDADEEIIVLRDRLAKAKAVKQGMMQELLTGRTRLKA